MNQDDLLISRIEDRIRQSETGWYTTTVDFLDLHEQSVAKGITSYLSGTAAYFYGGYPEAERRMLLLTPKDLNYSMEEVLAMDSYLEVIRIRPTSGGRKLTHRDYLGSVLGLGIDRRLIGDILVTEEGADMIVRPEITDFLLQEYHSVGRADAVVTRCSIEDLQVPEKRVQVITDTLPSLRLDNVISTAFRVSRSEAQKAIRSGIVFVDHVEIDKVDRKVEEGTVVILRGKGKARLIEVGGRSRKDRVWVKIERYI